MDPIKIVEELLEQIEGLPHEVSRNLKLMKDLEVKQSSIMIDIDRLSLEFRANETPRQKRERVVKILALQDRAKAFADEKVELADKTFALVDKHLQDVNSKVAEMEAAKKSSLASPPSDQ